MLTFKNTKALTFEEVALLKLKTNEQLPEYLINFFSKYSNSIPSFNSMPYEFHAVFPDGDKYLNYIERIIGIEGIVAELSERETLALYVKHFELSSDFVQIEYLCPFAYPPNGVLYCSFYGKHKGKIYFSDNGDFGILYVADSFDNFWNNLI